MVRERKRLSALCFRYRCQVSRTHNNAVEFLCGRLCVCLGKPLARITLEKPAGVRVALTWRRARLFASATLTQNCMCICYENSCLPSLGYLPLIIDNSWLDIQHLNQILLDSSGSQEILGVILGASKYFMNLWCKCSSKKNRWTIDKELAPPSTKLVQNTFFSYQTRLQQLVNSNRAHVAWIRPPEATSSRIQIFVNM